mgnify:CR=1 FL=1
MTKPALAFLCVLLGVVLGVALADSPSCVWTTAQRDAFRKLEHQAHENWARSLR